MNAPKPADAVPRNREMEQSVLGSLMLEDGLMARFADQVRETDFYWEQHIKIWLAIKKLHEEKQPTDAIMVGHILEASQDLDGCGGRAYLTQCVASVVSTASLDGNLKALRELSVARQLQELASVIRDSSQSIGDTSALEVLGQIESSLSKIALGATSNPDERWLVEVAEGSHDRIIAARETGTVGFKSGFKDLDKCTRGFRWGSMIEIAGRPGSGKSSIAMEMAWRQAQAGIAVGFITLEMNPEDMVDRLLQSIAGLTADELLASYAKAAVDKALSALLNVPICISRCPSTTDAVCNALRRMRFKRGCKVFYIDHFQCIRDQGYDSDQRMYADSLRRIRNVVDELEIDGEKPALILLVQLNRETEKVRQEPRPKLHQLRDTGRLEIEGDMVLGIYRPEMYTTAKEDEKNLMEISVLKNRFGPVGKTVRLCFFADKQKFSDWAMGERVSDERDSDV